MAARPLNRIIGETINPDVDAVAVLAARIEGDGHPYLVETRPGARGLERWCRGRGFTDFATVPLMTCPTSRLRSPRVEGVTWRALGVEDMPAHVEVAEAGYEMPPHGLGGFEHSMLFGEQGGAGLLAEVDGAPARTGVSVIAGDWVGVVIVGTVPAFRRRGIGAALTARLVTDAVARNGVSQALLQSSAMGKGVYESLGFVTVEQWTRWARM